MSRPKKCRRVCVLPKTRQFGPLGPEEGFHASPVREPVFLNLEEYEAIRLMDLLDFTQEECAAQMKVARTTVQAIYHTARRKLAQAIVEGRQLLIQGGDYVLCGHSESCCGKACRASGCAYRTCQEEGGCHNENCSYL